MKGFTTEKIGMLILGTLAAICIYVALTYAGCPHSKNTPTALDVLKVLPSYDRSGYVWTVPRGYINHITLDKRLYPEVTFENSPMEVELKLKK